MTVTDRALHVITGPECNEMDGLQRVITDQKCNRAPENTLSALQIGPVITRNPPSEIAPLDMTVPKIPVLVCDNKEYIRIPVLIPGHTDFDEYAVSWRRHRDQQPKTCPACGSSWILPNFVELSSWDCARCGRQFCPRD